jgi:hypothetical protein
VKNPANGEQVSKVTDLSAFVARARVRAKTDGIEVREQELVTITAQRIYRMRCGCGRSWFELQLPHLVSCPACEKMGLVSL